MSANAHIIEGNAGRPMSASGHLFAEVTKPLRAYRANTKEMAATADGGAGGTKMVSGMSLLIPGMIDFNVSGPLSCLSQVYCPALLFKGEFGMSRVSIQR